MTKTKVYKRISKRACDILKSDESIDVEFKRNGNNLKGEDLVSFANSPHGGTILIGVDEYKDKEGRQKTEVVGCTISDENKIAIVSKAQQCSPTVEVEIFIENNNQTPFYRVEIPSGKNKPYSSSGGTYKIRKDGRKEALLPQDLLNIFMAEEAGKFLQKFKESTTELRKELKEQNDHLIQEMFNNAEETENNLQTMLDAMQYNFDIVSANLLETEQEIANNLQEIDQENFDSNERQERSIDSMEIELETTNRNIISLAKKLNAILEHHKIEDPEITEEREFIKTNIAMYKGAYGKKQVPKTKIKELYSKHTRLSRISRNNFSLEDFEKWFDELAPIK